MPGIVSESSMILENGIELSTRFRLVIIMVGLPARGKSYISQKLARYLNWLQLETKVFNAGQTRRLKLMHMDDNSNQQSHIIDHPANFFDPSDKVSVAKRASIALQTLDELLSWLNSDNHSVGILDATNSTSERRRMILDHLRACPQSNREILFLESCCYDTTLLEQNFQLKLSGPDYKHHLAQTALADFQERVRLYEKSYETIGGGMEERDVSYLKLIDVGRQVIANNVNGYLSSQVVEYLLNFRLHKRTIWITRNGESHDDAEGKIGRSSPLSQKGQRFAASLARFMHRQRRQSLIIQQSINESEVSDKVNFQRDAKINDLSKPKFSVWTSSMQQAIETSLGFTSTYYDVRQIRTLNDVNAGKMEGLTLNNIASQHPEEMAARLRDPLNYRWPGSGGESYADVIHRLRPVIMELERTNEDVVLVTHRAVVRIILAYFQELDWNEITSINVPLEYVFAVEPSPYGVVVQTFRYDDSKDDFERILGDWRKDN